MIMRRCVIVVLLFGTLISCRCGRREMTHHASRLGAPASHSPVIPAVSEGRMDESLVGRSTSPPKHIETLVNTYTYNRQLEPAVDSDSHGNLLVVWGSRRQELGTFGVFAQRLDPTGRRLGTEMHVNQTVRGMQRDPSVSFDGDEAAWIVWQAHGQDGRRSDIIARRLGPLPDGTFCPRSDEIRINQRADGYQANPVVVANCMGKVLFAWTSDRGGKQRIMGRLMASDGRLLGDEFQLSQGASGRESQPILRRLNRGRFLVVWARTDSTGKPGKIFARRFDAHAAPLEDDFMVNERDGRIHIEPSADTAADGRFVVTWLTWQDSNYAVSCRRFGSDGAPQGQAHVIARSDRWISGACVAVAPDGRFAVSYNLNVDQDHLPKGAPSRPSHQTTPCEIRARRFAANGKPFGADFRVNRFNEGRQALRIAASGRQALWSRYDQLAFVWNGNTGMKDHRGVSLSLFYPESLGTTAPPQVASRPAAQSLSSAEVYPLIPPEYDPNFIPEPRDPISPLRGVDFGFLGIQNTGWNPPDPDIAAGPNDVVLVVNGEIGFFTQAGVQTFGQPIAGAGGFWGSVGATSFVFDPVALYDVHSGRFVVAAAEHADNGDMALNLAVSDDSDPNGLWNKYRFIVSGFGDFIDFPNLGVDSQAIYITADFFDPPTGNWIFIIDKAPVLIGDPVTPVGIKTSSSQRSLGNVKTYDANAPAQYFATSFNNGNSSITLDALTDPLGTPTRTSINLSVPFYGNPPDAPQLGTSNLADTVDARIKNGVYRNGSLWLAHTIGQNSTARVRWYEIQMNGWPSSGQTPTLFQSGTIDLGVGEFNWFPDIGVDDQGNAILAFNRSSVNQFISVERAVRFYSDPLGTFQPPVILQQSTSAETGTRWGDYAGVDEDPDNPGTFWTHHEYRTSSWRTWVGQVSLFLPLQISLPNGIPAQLELGQSADITVSISPGSDTLVPSSPTFHYRYDGGAFLTVPLVSVGGDLYSATLPAAACPDMPEFYVSAVALQGGAVTNPPDAPLSVFSVPVAVAVDRWDDGTHEGDVGPPSGGQIAWLNHFVVRPGFQTISAVQIAWAAVADGTPATVYLWSDPDGDGKPLDAQVLASANTMTENANTDLFSTVDLPDIFVGPIGTNYFVGAILSLQAGEKPASLDNGLSAGQSWVAADALNPIDPNSLNTAGLLTVRKVESIGQPGNLLVRAVAAVTDCNNNGQLDVCDIAEGLSLDCNANGLADDCEFPGCPGILNADMNCDGMTNGADVPRFVETILSVGFTCQADMDQNGTVDASDVPLFVNALLGL